MEVRTKLVSLTTGVSKRTNRSYYHAWFKKLGDEKNDELLLEKWLDEEVGSMAVAQGLLEITKKDEPEVKLAFGFGGSITSITLVDDVPIDFN